MLLRGLIIAGLTSLAAPVVASDVLNDPQLATKLVADVCIPETLDFVHIFETASDAAVEAGLTAFSDTDKARVYGNPMQSHLVFTRSIDSVACILTVRTPTGSREYFDIVEAQMENGIKAQYPDTLSVYANLPSPHEEKHDWVFSVAAEKHFAATLSWQVEDGVLLAIGYRQIYE